jgi:hypothetical protein
MQDSRKAFAVFIRRWGTDRGLWLLVLGLDLRGPSLRAVAHETGPATHSEGLTNLWQIAAGNAGLDFL